MFQTEILDNCQQFAITGIIISAVLVLVFRNKLLSHFDQLQVASIQCGMALSCLYWEVISHNSLIIYYCLEVFLFIVVFYISLGSINKYKNSFKKLASDYYINRTSYIISYSILALFLALNIIFNMGMLSSHEIGVRSDLKNNAFLWLLMFSLIGPIIALSALLGGGRITTLQIVTILALYFQTYVMGSKAGLIYLIVCILILLHFQSLFWGKEQAKNKNNFTLNKIYLLVLFIISITGIIVIFPHIIHNKFIETIFIRLATQFDAFYIIDMSQDSILNIPDVNLLEYWFSSPLKVLGLYHNKYNGINEFIVESSYGSIDKYPGLLPNNPIVLESLFSFGILGGTIFIIISAFVLGYTFRVSAKYVSSHRLFLFIYSFIAASPFSLLFEGQNTINSFLALIIVFVVAEIFIFSLRFKKIIR
jgi:hypothetical protein